jgi:hypothetical protein
VMGTVANFSSARPASGSGYNATGQEMALIFDSAFGIPTGSLAGLSGLYGGSSGTTQTGSAGASISTPAGAAAQKASVPAGVQQANAVTGATLGGAAGAAAGQVQNAQRSLLG